MYRDLLVHVDGRPSGRERVKFAATLAERIGASLSGHHVTPPAEVPPVYKAGMIPKIAAKMTADLAQDARDAAAIFSQETCQAPIKASWSQSSGDIAKEVCIKARYADPVILGQGERQGSPEKHPFPMAHSVVLNCGRPVLILPAVPLSSKFGKIIVAWDGSREAVRALHDALPLLALTHSVQVIRIVGSQDENGELDSRHLVAHLHNHGINIGAGVLQIRTDNEHGSLRDHIDEGHYDLLVMGAYSHPMWMEVIFGGAAPSLLTSKIPIFVSH